MICHCVRCKFTFEAIRLPERCPDCGKTPVRAATVREREEYARYRRECGPMRVYGLPAGGRPCSAGTQTV